MPLNDLCNSSAVNLARALASGDVGCVEVMDAHLARIEAVNPRLNAIVTFDGDRARDTARAFDTNRPKGDARPPLWGLPTAHKDLVLTRGVRTTFGSPLYANHIPNEDDLIVERIRAAGAISVGKTNTPEFGAGSQTFNRVFGATRNPYDPTTTCGGSSGGAAVTLAARMLPLADGSDLGGSLRNPAAFCNVLGLRPTPGRVPARPTLNPWSDMAVQGPMARSVDDIALFLSVLVGDDKRVPFAFTDPPSAFHPVTPLELRGVRVALTNDFGLPVQAEIRACIDATGVLLESLGATVEHACPDLSGATEVFHVMRANSFHARFGTLPSKQRAELKDTIQWNLAAGEALTVDDLHRAYATRRAIFERVAAFFDRYDFLVGPTTQVVPFDVEQPYPTDIDGVPMHDYLEWMQSCARITVTSCPALSLPAGFSRSGLPIGMQIVAPVRAEARLLSFAKSVEASTQHAQRAPAMLGRYTAAP
jgi:amidase